MLSLKRFVEGGRYQVRDLIGIIFLLTIGIFGQFYLSDPLKVLAPNLPMLSLADWPGSRSAEELRIVDSRAWQEKRGFYRSIALFEEEMPLLWASQTLTWYADPEAAKAAWAQQQGETYTEQFIVSRNTDRDKPESVLFCITLDTDVPSECWYHAYWAHWYTEVNFSNRTDPDRLFAEMQKLTNRTDQLLMSAPNRPCQGFSCTEQGRNQASLVVISVFIMMLIATFGIIGSRTRIRKDVSSASLTENLPVHLPQGEPKAEFRLPSPSTEAVSPSSQARLDNTSKLEERSINLSGVPVMAFVMLGLMLTPLYFYIRTKDFHYLGLEDWYWVIIIVTIGIVSGGVLGVRILHASWRQVVVASLCAGAGMMLLSRFEFAPFYPGPWDNPERVFNPIAFLITSCLFTAPTFLLPLFDPALRQKGPAPSTWKVALTALSLSLLFGLSTYLSSVRRDPGWSEQVGYTLLSGILLSGVLIGLGLILALVDRRTEEAGPWMGGVGILLAVFLLTIWFVLGGWFP